MNAEDQKIKKVILEFNDCVKVIEGENAVEWLEMVDNMSAFGEIHNNNPFKGYDYSKIKVLTKEEYAQQQLQEKNAELQKLREAVCKKYNADNIYDTRLSGCTCNYCQNIANISNMANLEFIEGQWKLKDQ